MELKGAPEGTEWEQGGKRGEGEVGWLLGAGAGGEGLGGRRGRGGGGRERGERGETEGKTWRKGPGPDSNPGCCGTASSAKLPSCPHGRHFIESTAATDIHIYIHKKTHNMISSSLTLSSQTRC